VLKNIESSGYENPTPIQMQAIPVMLKVGYYFLMIVVEFFSHMFHVSPGILEVCNFPMDFFFLYRVETYLVSLQLVVGKVLHFLFR